MPPKRKNQASRNAFYFFMLEFQDRQGKKFNSMKEVADAAGPHWSRMTKEEREPYEQKAAKAKGGARLTSDGIEVDELERQEREEQARIREMKEDIHCNLKLAAEANRIQDEMFFIIHMNIFCYCTSEDRYYPAEIGVSCFTLEDGILPQNVFSRIIKPGALPLGFAGEAKLISNQTHLIPIPLAGDYECNMKEIFVDLKQFLSTKLCGSKRFPCLYADEKMIKMIQHILDTWCYDYGESKPLFKVYNLQYMFRELKNCVANALVWQNDTFSCKEIEKDAYAYSNGICCDFHDTCDVYVHCSRSVVTRYAYTICDNCCQDLGIYLIPGQHIPDNKFAINSRSSSRASVISGFTKSSTSSVCDDDLNSVLSYSSKSEWDNKSQVSESNCSYYSLDSGSFPGLDHKSRANSQPNYTSDSSMSQASSRSYAGASKLNNSNSGFIPIRNEFSNDDSNFPALSGERGFRGRGGRGRRKY